jgi:peptidoglycan/LPS O-acetylase OafA/YrhL
MKYITQLDGIRGLAIILVLIGHWSTPPLKNLLPWGNIGVYTFFVISGYLIAKILLKQKIKQNLVSFLTSFWARRILRIFPIYYLTLLILWLVQHPPIADHAIWHFAYLSNFLFMSSAGFQDSTSHLWSLAVEAQFYLFWPFIIFWLKDKYVFYTTIFFLILSPICRLTLFTMGLEIPVIKVFTGSSLDFLGMGALIALAQKNPHLLLFGIKPERLLKIICPFAVAIFSLLQILQYLGYQNVYSYLIGTSSLVICCGWLISSASYGMEGIFKNILESKILRFIGTISYGLYLYHFFIAFYLKKWFPNLALDNLEQNAWVRFMIFSIVSFVVATISWFTIEKPLLGLKKYFASSNSKASNAHPTLPSN